MPNNVISQETLDILTRASVIGPNDLHDITLQKLKDLWDELDSSELELTPQQLEEMLLTDLWR